MMQSISVVLCTYNGEKFLREQLDSVLAQSVGATEIIIQDDCSSDSTRDIILEYAAAHTQIRPFLNDTNMGFRDNFQSAMRRAQCDFVAFCDQDDIWETDHLQTLAEIIPGKVLACADAMICDAQCKPTGLTLSAQKWVEFVPDNDIEKAWRLFYNTCAFQGASMLVRREWLEKALPIPDGVGFHDTWLYSAACLTGGVAWSSKVITRYRQHGRNVTAHTHNGVVSEINRHSHFNFPKDRVLIVEAISSRFPGLSGEAQAFLSEWKAYAEMDKKRYLRLKSWKFREDHYRLIYTTESKKYLLIRKLHYLLAV